MVPPHEQRPGPRPILCVRTSIPGSLASGPKSCVSSTTFSVINLLALPPATIYVCSFLLPPLAHTRRYSRLALHVAALSNHRIRYSLDTSARHQPLALPTASFSQCNPRCNS